MKTVLKALCAAGVMLLGMTLPAGAQTSSGDVKGFKYEANLMVGVMQMAYDSDEFRLAIITGKSSVISMRHTPEILAFQPSTQRISMSISPSG